MLRWPLFEKGGREVCSYALLFYRERIFILKIHKTKQCLSTFQCSPLLLYQVYTYLFLLMQPRHMQNPLHHLPHRREIRAVARLRRVYVDLPPALLLNQLNALPLRPGDDDPVPFAQQV